MATVANAGGVHGTSVSSAATTGMFTKLGNGLFMGAESDAHLFVASHLELAGAPLKYLKSTILDSDRACGGSPPITVLPPKGVPARVHSKRKTRRLNDQKALTTHGQQALDRPTRGGGQLWQGSVVWRFEYQCAGVADMCDWLPEITSRGCACAARVVYSPWLGLDFISGDVSKPNQCYEGRTIADYELSSQSIPR